MPMKTAREALAKTLKQNKIALVTGVYGDPCTALLDECATQGLHVEISTEEKVAFAQALGASVAGLPSVVIVKQVGVNVLADPLVTAVTHGIGAGLLLIAGDDPGAAKSQNEQDSRWYAKLAHIPVLTPPGPQYVSDAAIEGLQLSGTLGIPVMLQVTARLLDGEGRPSEMPLTVEARFDRDRAWKNLILDRYKYFYQKIYPQLCELVEDSPLHRMPEALTPARERGYGVISCGFVSTLVTEKNHFALGYAHPLPERALVSFLKNLESVLVVEEIAPIIEESVNALVARHGLTTKVLGRLTGHLPRIGPLQAQHISEAWGRDPRALYLDIPTHVSGGILDLPCGGFELLYQVLDEVLPEGYLVAGDVGCSILHGYFPPQVIDTAYALGTSIATAAGMSFSGRKGVAIIGDTGFIHSGITGLLNAVEHQHDVLVIILYNKSSAMTPGAQAIPGLERVRALVEACGVATIDEIAMEQISPEELKKLVERRLGERGVQVLLAHARPKKLHE
uniref:Indolepyruvate oxidoreductase subunit IorA n=2 Tax=Candidatus Bipolaricaulota TaxID=67810 RepID=H5SNK5_9BACT|nr:indolepyruvate ferredoxin oxidoreductase, alpha subunit [uncultured Acetothermia bacterium]BAL59069.1 indolepyruvate ferredoxin oxidoreductase, alpha subunit [Candidatus Acetothermum autotrophicum]